MLQANARREEIYHLALTTGLASVEEQLRSYAFRSGGRAPAKASVYEAE